MSEAARTLQLRESERNRHSSAGFWTVGFALTLALVIAFPPTRAIGTTAGISVAAALAVMTLAYITRLRRIGGAVGVDELFWASIVAAVAIGLDQWLCGGFGAPLYLIFSLHVLGTASVQTDRRRRVAHLAVVSGVTIAPLVYGTATAANAVTAAVFVALLTIEAALLADFGQRLRSQQEALEQAAHEASERALTDALTGLGNRAALTAHLDAAGAVTIAYFDLDGFKAYNDRFGHAAGDDLLCRLSTNLRSAIGSRGTAFRLGGDEFCAVIDGAAEPGLVDSMVAALSEDSSRVEVAPSWGVAKVPAEAGDAATAMRLADERMYRRKRSSRLNRDEEAISEVLRAFVEVGPAMLDEGADVSWLADAVAERLGGPRSASGA